MLKKLINKRTLFVAVFIILLGLSWYFVKPKTLNNYADLSVLWGVVIALIVYITNSYYQYKQRISENAIRYMEMHSKLFENEFLKNNIQAMEDGTFKRKKKMKKILIVF